MRRISLAYLFCLAACQQSAPSSTPVGGEAASAVGLERAAIDSGVIADAARTSPVGLYQRQHESGRDALCIVPAKTGEFRFGLEAMFGEQQSCRGHGLARRAGDKLILSFAGRGDHCLIVGQYDGDQLSLPGVVDLKCNNLCEGRGSLEGVSFPRLSSDAASALRAADRSGRALCDPGYGDAR